MTVNRHRGPVFWVTAAAGWGLIAWGLRGVFAHEIDTRPRDLARFVFGGALLHDLVLVPIVLLVGLGVARVVPARWRAYVQVAAVISACVALFAYPLVRGFGHAHNNPTSLPHNYAANLALVVGAVWLGVAVVAVVRAARARRSITT